MERLRGSTATALAGAAKTWKIGSFQTSVARFTATLVLALLLSPQGCDVQPVAAVKQQRRSFEDTWKAQAAERVESFTAVAAAFATTGNETRRALHQIARVGEEGEEGVGRRCWISENGRSRCYANVFFVGFEKCGTTSLASWMAHHPTLRWVSNSGHFGQGGFEAHVLHLSTAIIKPRLLPTSKFKYATMAPEAEEEDRVIDYTPRYAIMPRVPYRILRLYGNSSFDGSTKYFVSLREPAARAISAWEYKFMGIRAGDFWGDDNALLRHHVGNSMYALHLERWFAVVGRENVKVLFLEELHDDPVETLRGIFEFIGLDFVDSDGAKGLEDREKWEKIVQDDSNITEDKRKEILGAQVTPELVQMMRDYFAPHNAKLEELLGRPLPDSWSTPINS